MYNRIKRPVKLVSAALTATLFMGFLPWRELKADMNTHGDYDAYPFEITYEQVSTWNNSTQDEYTLTNTSDYEIRSWTIEVDYYEDTTISNIWNASDVTDYETDENLVIAGNVTIPAGESYSFGLIADGAESTPVAPIDVNTVSFDSDEVAVVDTEEEGTVEETVTDVPDSVDEIIPDVVEEVTDEAASSDEEVDEVLPEEEAEPTIFPFAIYAGSTESDYTFAGWKSEITGDIYAGGNVLYQGSELYMDGTIYAGGTISADGWRIEVTDMVEDSEVFEMPDWSESILAKEDMYPEIDIADLESQDQILTSGYYYSEDDITINGTTFTGDVIIVSKGDITYNVESLNYGEEATGRILLYSEEGDITINGSRIEINGMLYAPNGRVSFNTYDTTINGRIIADEFSYSGSILNVTADYSDLQLAEELPEVTVTASRDTVYVGGYAYYTIEIPEDTVYDILYRLNGEDVEIEIPEDEDAAIIYVLDTDEEGEYTLEAYVSLPNGEFVLDCDTIEVIAEPTATPEPTATNTPTPEPTATNTPTPTSTPTPVPTATSTPTPTLEPTATPIPTSVPVVVPTPVNTVTPTPEPYGPTPAITVTPTPAPTSAPEDPYGILSIGDPVYGYQRLFDPSEWSNDRHHGARLSDTELRVGNRVNSYEITGYLDQTTQFSPDYSFAGRFTYSIDCDVEHDNCSNLTIAAVGPRGRSQGSFTIHIDISPSRRHNWKDPYGQGDWQSGTEPSPSAIGIYLNGDTLHEYCYAEYMGFIDSGSLHEIWFEYDGVDKVLYVYVAPYDDEGNVTKPEAPTLMLNIDLEELFGGSHSMALFVWGDGLDHPADFVYHGIEFDPYPYIHGDYVDDIYLISLADGSEVMQRETIDVFGIVNNDDARTTVVSFMDPDGNVIFEESSDTVHYSDHIAYIDTNGLDAGVYELNIKIYDEFGELLSEKTTDINLVYDPVVEASIGDYVLAPEGLYIRGTIDITEDSSWILSMNDPNGTTDSWSNVSVGTGNMDNEYIGFIPAEDLPNSGSVDLMLVVTCESGAIATRTQTFYFYGGGNYIPPSTPTPVPGEYTDEELFCDIEDSQDGEEVSFITDIIGTVSGTELQNYTFEVFPTGSEEAVYTYTGSGEVEESVVGTVDPTLLVNGFYVVKLTANAENGYVEDSIVVLVTGQAKVGNYSISFLDMSLPVAGLPVEVYRTYDSRQRTQMGDFGYGWNMSVGGPSISVSGDLGYGWGNEQRTTLMVPLHYYKEAYPHEIYVDWGNGESETFAVTLTADGWITAPLYTITASMTNLDGTGDTLTILDANSLLSYDQENSTIVFPNRSVFNPQNFLLTRYDGMKFYFNIDTGLYRVEDTYGRYIDITDDGINYSEGGMISFNRDESGRITSISDGLGNEVSYTYDEAGNLISVNDTANYTTSFAYDDGHYLTDITADNGVTVSRNEYDDDGRLIAVIDADGNRIEFQHDLDARMEVSTDRLGYSTVYYYDENGNVTSVTDALGRTTTYTFDSNNNKTSETRPDGTTFTYSYDENGNLLTANDGNGRTISSTYGSHGELLTMSAMGVTELSMAYDEHGNLLSATDSSGNTQEYVYNGSGDLTSVSDSLGSLMNMSYDGDGNVTSITNAEGQVTNFSYDGEGRLTSRSITYQGTTLTDTYSYDAANRVTGITYANGNTVSYSYNQAGDVTASTDGQGRTVNYTYDIYGNLTRISYPDGTSESFTYDAEGRNLTATDRMGRTATFTYDAVGNCTSKTYANGANERYTYDECNRVVSATNVYGATTTYGYDYLGRNTSVTDANGNTTYYSYNDRGNVSSVTDPAGNTYTFTYDNNGNQTSVAYPNGSTFNTTYDVRGRMTSQRDAYGNTTTYSYDSMDRLVCVTDALGSSWTYEYDSMGNITSVTDAEGYTTTYTYDLNGQVTSVTNAAGNTATNSYNQYGRVIASTDYAGVETTYTYDSMDRVATATVDGEVTTYSYSSVGNLVSVADSAGTIFYTYNIDGYLSSVTNASGEVISYTYDEAGQIASMTIDGQTISYGYDNMGRLVTVTDSEGTTSYTYDAVGNRASTEYPNGVTTTYGYNENNVLISEVSTDSTGTVLASYEYTIGANNERLTCTELNRTVEYEYDELERLVSETVTTGDTVSVTTYTYDANSNRVSMDKDGDVTTYEYNELNQLVRAGEIEYTWDNAGNLVSQTTTSGVIVATYTYDSYNRMVSASVNSNSGTLEQEYTYDYLGNRTSKTTDGVTTYYVTDLSSGYSQVLKATTGSDVIYYTRGFELISRNEGTEASYYLYDGGMSVRGITDETGTLTDTYVFDAFGNEVARTGTTDNSYGYRGEEQDETGLYYLRARYMDPSTGTFTTMDTYAGRLSDPMSLHKYMYANSNPVKYCDPSGHFTMVETMLAVALVSELAAAVVYGVTVTTTDRIQYNSLGEAIAGSLSVAIGAMALGLFFWMMYMVLAVIVSVAFAAVLFALFGIGMSALGIANGILDIKEGDKVLGWTEIIISVIFLLLSLKTLNEYNPITPNKRGAVRIGGFSDNGGNDNRTTDRTVHAWQARNDGNPTQPAGARPQRDFGVSSRSDFVGPEIPSNDGSTHGASTNSNPNCGLHGTSWHLEEGTELPQGLGFVPDGRDVNPNSSNGPGHCTIYPTDTMTVDEFNELFQRLPWIQD